MKPRCVTSLASCTSLMDPRSLSVDATLLSLPHHCAVTVAPPQVNASASPSCHSFLHSAPRRLFCWAHTPLYSTFVHAGKAGQSEPQQNRSDEAESRELQGTGCEYVTALCRASTAMLSWHHCHLSLATTQTPCLTCQLLLLCCLLRAVLLLAVDAGYSCQSAAGHQVRSSTRVPSRSVESKPRQIMSATTFVHVVLSYHAS